MPLIPATFVQALPAFSSGTTTINQNLAFLSNVTQGDLIYVYVFGTVGTVSGGNPTGNTLTFNSLHDTQNNSYVGSGIIQVQTSDGPPIVSTALSYFGL